MSKYIIVEGLHSYSRDEKMFLKQWVNGNAFYTKVRNEYREKRPNTILEKMFSTYDSKYKKDKPLYRGLSFNKTMSQEFELYKKLRNSFMDAAEDKDEVVIDFAPASFTIKESIANHFAKNIEKDYCSILFKVEQRITNEIDACSDKVGLKTIYQNEDEIILKSHKMIFTILHLSEKNDKLEIILKEI
ncbi:MAG: hypothetical protein U9O24_00925 [Campylobacterota bacterium]|nr:hypothetical protein [Campylobacterota bacterium]